MTGSFDTESLGRNLELAQKCHDLATLSTTVEAHYILNGSIMQTIEPFWSSGVTTVEEKVCAVPCLEFSVVSITHTHRSDGLRCHRYGKSQVFGTYTPCP